MSISWRAAGPRWGIAARGLLRRATWARPSRSSPTTRPGRPASATPGYTSADQPITVGLGEDDAAHMFIDLLPAVAEGQRSRSSWPTPGQRRIVSSCSGPIHQRHLLRGRAQRRGCQGRHDVGETGDMNPGPTMMLSVPGHYTVVCNPAGHYAIAQNTTWCPPARRRSRSAWARRMPPACSSTCPSVRTEGKVTFIITNQGAEDHEFVVLKPTQWPRTSRS